MLNCPNCGSIIQILPCYEELQKIGDMIKIIIHFNCGCGNFFKEETTYLKHGQVKIENENK